MTYKNKLQNPKWQKKRLEILKRDKWKCKLCKDEETELHVHHLEYNGEPWDVDNSKLVTLCAHCHYEVENVGSDTDFSEIKIHKITDWTNNGRVVFIRLNGASLHIHIYDSNGAMIVPLEFPEYALPDIKKIFT